MTSRALAAVPLFACLDLTSLGAIARLLTWQGASAGRVVVRRGEPADAMFFIVSGEVAVDVPPVPRRLGPGQFFGEIALLRDTVRTATVTASTECRLLALGVTDFRHLLEAHPDLKAAITRVAAARLASDGRAAGPTPEPATPARRDDPTRRAS